MKIAVEFDGTIVEDKYPEIGREKPLATFILRNLQERGHLIVLYTSRKEEKFEDAVEWLKNRGVNVMTPLENENISTIHRSYSKPEADLYIDHRNLGGIPVWRNIYWMIHPDEARYVRLRYNSTSSFFRKVIRTFNKHR